MNTCGNCKHWTPYDQMHRHGRDYVKSGQGSCSRIQTPRNVHDRNSGAWMDPDDPYCVPGLCTDPDFGCTLFEGKE